MMMEEISVNEVLLIGFCFSMKMFGYQVAIPRLNEDIDKTCNKKKKLPKVFALKRIDDFFCVHFSFFYFQVNIPVNLIDKINHLIANNQQQQQHCSFIVSPCKKVV